MLLYLVCFLIGSGALSFLLATFSTKQHPEMTLPETEERLASDPLEDIAYSSWKQHTFSKN